MPLQLIHPVHRATHQIGLYVERLREPGLTQADAHILAALVERGHATVGELYRSLAHKRSTLTSILDRLEKRRLIKREIAVPDRRSFVIRLTGRGRRLADKVSRHLKKLERAVARKFSAAQIKSFSRVISAIEQQARHRASKPLS